MVADQDLPQFLSNDEIALIDRVYAINPAIYGFRGPKLSIEPVPERLVRVAQEPYAYEGTARQTKVQYIPEAPYAAYRAMAEAMSRQIGRRLLIASSYRSSAFQALVFLSILRLYQFDVARTARRVAIPGYSEHGTPSRLAVDFLNVEGLPSDRTPQDFAGTVEYRWLVDNAPSFGFCLSYPEDNPFKVMFEPWHWRYDPSFAS